MTIANISSVKTDFSAKHNDVATGIKKYKCNTHYKTYYNSSLTKWHYIIIILPLIMYLRSLGSESIVCKAINSSAGLTGGFAFEHV